MWLDGALMGRSTSGVAYHSNGTVVLQQPWQNTPAARQKAEHAEKCRAIVTAGVEASSWETLTGHVPPAPEPEPAPYVPPVDPEREAYKRHRAEITPGSRLR